MTYLGVETSQVPDVVSEQLGLAKGLGLVVEYVESNSPAASAGVQQNDILKMLNDQILIEPSQLRKLLQTFPEGTEVTLTILRKGKEQKLTIKLAKKEVPQRHSMIPGGNHDWHWDFDETGDLGEQMQELKEQLKEQLGDTRGIVRGAVIQAHEAARHAREDARRAAREIHILSRDNGALLPSSWSSAICRGLSQCRTSLSVLPGLSSWILSPATMAPRTSPFPSCTLASCMPVLSNSR